MSDYGKLFLVATPIGNLEDMSYRAIRILKEVQIIAAEDTRQTIKLLNHYKIKNSMVSYHEHNKFGKGNFLIRELMNGKNIALVSDAGTPGISDPGGDLVKNCIENNIEVSMIPGPVAAIMGLVISGLKATRFVFEGFLPKNKRLKKERILGLKEETRTIILYEAPHKLISTLNILNEVFGGERQVVFTKELTKKYENCIRLQLKNSVDYFTANPPLGEFVVIIEGKDEEELKSEAQSVWNDIPVDRHVQKYIDEGLDKKEAIKKVAKERGLSKREVYGLVIN